MSNVSSARGLRRQPLPSDPGTNKPVLCSGSEAGSYLRRIDSCITPLKAQGPSRTCNESKEERNKPAKARFWQWNLGGVLAAPASESPPLPTLACQGSVKCQAHLETTSQKCAALSYLRLIDFVYHSTLGLRVIKKKKKRLDARSRRVQGTSREQGLGLGLEDLRFRVYGWF